MPQSSSLGSPGALPGQIILGDGAATLDQANPDGTYVISFTDVVPPIRYDGVPWTTVQIQQATALAGPWTPLETQTFDPDADPGDPQSRNFTTSLATVQEGFFALTFVDSVGASSQPFVQVMNQPSQVRPSVSDLGSFMRARTVSAGSGGQEQGTFTATTRPTAAEADLLIDQAVSAVLMQTGEEVPDHLIAQTKFAVLLYSAMLVELTFYRNEVNRDQSSYAQYEALFQQTVAALKGAISDQDPASVAPSFWSVPSLSSAQARFQAYVNATDPTTGVLDPSKLPPDQFYPAGPGGIPAAMLAQYPWLGGEESPFGGDWMIAELEAPD